MGSGDVYFAVSQRGNTQKEPGIGLPGMILDNGFAGLFDLSILTAPHGFTCLREQFTEGLVRGIDSNRFHPISPEKVYTPDLSGDVSRKYRSAGRRLGAEFRA
jgi:hypothetical protein